MKKRLLLVLFMFITVIGLTGCMNKNYEELDQQELYRNVIADTYNDYKGKYYKISGDISMIEDNALRIQGYVSLQYKVVFKNTKELKNLKVGDKVTVTGRITEIYKVDNKPTTIVVDDGKLVK